MKLYWFSVKLERGVLSQYAGYNNSLYTFNTPPRLNLGLPRTCSELIEEAILGYRQEQYASNYHVCQRRLKQTFDPNELSDHLMHISGKEQVP